MCICIYAYTCVNMCIYAYITCMYIMGFRFDGCEITTSLRRGHANMFCIVPSLTDDLQREAGCEITT